MKKFMVFLLVLIAASCSNNDKKPIKAPDSDSTGQMKTDTSFNSSTGTLNTDTVGMSHRKSADSMQTKNKKP